MSRADAGCREMELGRRARAHRRRELLREQRAAFGVLKSLSAMTRDACLKPHLDGAYRTLPRRAAKQIPGGAGTARARRRARRRRCRRRSHGAGTLALRLWGGHAAGSS